MKRINFKLIFLILIGGVLLLTGCKTELTYIVNGFELQDQAENIYIQKYSNDILEVSLNNIIECNDKKAEIKFYDYNDSNIEISDNILLNEGDNIVTCIISNNKEEIVILLNFYRLKIFTVSFKTNCSTKIPSIQVEEDSLIEEPDVELKRSGYAFVGWDYKFNKPITSDLTIEAKWKANSFVVTYDPNGGDIEIGNTVVTYGEPYELDIPIKEGYIFLGWKYNGSFVTSENWSINQDVTLIAEWEVEEKTFEIEYVIVGAIGPNLQRTYSNKETVVLRTPYKSGHKFIGWYTDGQFKSERVFEIPAGTEGNLKFYSRWETFIVAGSNISFLGDSISTFYSSDSEVNSSYSGENEFYYPRYSTTVKTVDQTWWYQVIKETNANLLVNDSISGSTCYNWGSETLTTAAMNYSRINNLKGSDIVIVYIGANDNVNGFTTEQFTNAYTTMVKRIKEVCLDAFVFCCTLGYSDYTGYSYTEERRVEYNTIIKKIAQDYDAVLIDFSVVQNEETYSSLLGDKLHPNSDGMTALATKAVEAIRNHIG